MAAGLLLALPGMALAAKPGYLHVNESIEISAPPAKVWGLVKDWNGLHKWHPAFSNTEIKSGANNKVGAIRTLTLGGDGGKFDEELDGFSEKQRKYGYRIITDSPLPVADYSSTSRSSPARRRAPRCWCGRASSSARSPTIRRLARMTPASRK